jgi:hypothetical protein
VEDRAGRIVRPGDQSNMLCSGGWNSLSIRR